MKWNHRSTPELSKQEEDDVNREHSQDTDSEDERGFENLDYEDEPTYSVVARKMVTQGGRDTEYNTLVRSGDLGDKMQFESDSLHWEGSYSKLLMSQDLDL